MQAGFPPGVVNLVHGARETVDAMLEHPTIRAISFVGSSPGGPLYLRPGGGPRQAGAVPGGAKNPVIVLPDADRSMTTRIVADSAFGCAGQRCLAASLAVTVGEAGNGLPDAIAHTAATRTVGNGLDPTCRWGQ
jgi:malonate-semialdehyde dehydrogenase (acetylating)/methylmalonate-semialdehyde dehydrogenase